MTAVHAARPAAGRPRRLADAAVSVAVAAALAAYALRGGSYDVVARQEAALAAWWGLGLAVALGLLPVARPTLRALVALGLLAGFAALTGVSLAWSPSSGRTSAELARVVHHVGVLAVVICGVRSANWRAWARGLLGGMVLVCALALASRLAPGMFPPRRVAEAFQTARLEYPFGYWNALSAWAAMTGAALVACSAHLAVRSRRALACAAIPVAGACIYLTYSRAGILTAALGILAAVALSRHRWTAAAHAVAGALATGAVILAIRAHPEIAEGTGPGGALVVLATLVGVSALAGAVANATALLHADERWRMSPRRARPALVGGLVVAATALVVSHGALASAWGEFRRPASVTSHDPAARLATLNGYRYDIWSSAVHAFESAPAHGIGPGTFEFWWNRDGGLVFLRDAHSLYLEQMAELGLPGLLLVGGFVLALGAAALGGRRVTATPEAFGWLTALIAGFVVWAVYAGIDWMWESTAVTVAGLACAGVAAGAAAERAPALRRRGRAPVVLVAVVAVLVEVPGLVSMTLVRQSQAASAAGRVGDAAARATEAIDAEPWASSPYLQRALLAEDAGDVDAAASDLSRAIARERDNWRLWLVRARVEAERDRVDSAVESYRRARGLRPHSSFFGEPG